VLKRCGFTRQGAQVPLVVAHISRSAVAHHVPGRRVHVLRARLRVKATLHDRHAAASSRVGLRKIANAASSPGAVLLTLALHGNHGIGPRPIQQGAG
jgi:hypothetical protein